MKKVFLLILGLSFIPLNIQADCPDKIVYCEGPGLIPLNQKWNWGRAKCAPCENGCGYTYGMAQQFCSERYGIKKISSLPKGINLNEAIARYNAAAAEAHRKCQEYIDAYLGERDTHPDCHLMGHQEGLKASGLDQ